MEALRVAYQLTTRNSNRMTSWKVGWTSRSSIQGITEISSNRWFSQGCWLFSSQSVYQSGLY
eukprot:5817651-Karenia_brevis.AAC.1